ncbi:MAG TPA: hypothetical protein VN716_19500 [Vicinamibacterales bacterium]|nr:hypothetical protein [Vicinamibacterales bacterium]
MLLATMNSAGYRFAASDQAFYVPAVVRHLEPAAFPRDAALIDAQARLTLVDDLVAGAIRVTGLSLQRLFLVLYVTSLCLLVAAGVRIASHLYRTRLALLALAAALTLRHAVAKTGANTLEGYFHPRMLAFALGLSAVALLIERRERAAPILLAVAAAVHPTTAAWFCVWTAVTLWFSRPAWRTAMAGAAVATAAALGIAVAAGFGAARLTRMDQAWLAVIADRDYLFPTGWPIDAWLTNLVTIPIIVFCWRARARARLTVAGETPLVAGALALAVVFACWLPFDIARVALAVQLQTSRVFWMLDVLATIYLVWALAEGTRDSPGTRRTAIVASILLVASLARGLYISYVQFPDRRLFAVDLQHDDWREAMAWARTTDPGTGWLADPGHAAQYGSSLRAAGHRDVLVERLKDRAIAMYDRETAMRLADRERALAVLPWDTPDGARALALRFGLDYLIIDRELALPLAHRSGSLYIYRLR